MKVFIRNVAGVMAAAIAIGCGLLATGPIVNAAEVAIDGTNFPDEEFREYVATVFDSDSNGLLSQSEADSVVEIYCSNFFSCDKSHSLKGVELFSNLEELYAFDSGLTSIDVSKNTKLTNLNISSNEISSIDLTNNTELLSFYANNCGLKSLDLTNCTKLVDVYVMYNELTSLDVSNSKELTNFYCSNNNITAIDVTNNSKLIELDVGYNKLTILNTRYNQDLITISCSGNPIDELDLSNNSKLKYLYTSHTDITSLDVSGCSELIELYCGSCEIKTLDVSNNSEITCLGVYGNRLESLDISHNPNISYLGIDNNPMTSIDISGHAFLIDTYKNPDESHVRTYDLRGADAKYLVVNKYYYDVERYYSIEIGIDMEIIADGEVLPHIIPTTGPIPEAYVPETPEMSAGDFVNRCYSVALERSADEAGFNYWLDALNSGSACGAQLGYGFIFSGEYISKNKTNEEYVTDLYNMYFGRTPDDAGFNYWLDMLNAGSSRETVFAGFANSAEFDNLCRKYGVVTGTYIVGMNNDVQGGINCFVARMYSVFLYRLPDQGGQTGWVQKLIDGDVTGTSCAYGFVFSKEFIRENPEYERFVACMYRGFFGREPDAAGFDAWVQRLNTGASYEDVFEGFASSAEFYNLCDSYGINA